MSSPGPTSFPSMFERLTETAAAHPDRVALAIAAGRDGRGRTAFAHVSFRELWQRACQYAHGLRRLGVGAEDRVVILVPPGDDGVALAYAAMAVGATTVSVDPGMTARTMANCIEEAEATVMLGIDRAHLLRLLYPRSFRSVRLFVGERRLPRTLPLERVRLDSRLPFSQQPVDEDSTYAIVFTSGSTGRPKGVELSHRNFAALLTAVDHSLPAGENPVDLATYGLFILISCARGHTAVLPDMDIARPGACDPARIVEAIQTYRVAGGFGSPALWVRVADHCRARGITLPSVETVVSAGAPVPNPLVASLAAIVPHGRVHTPYGATEALPIASIDSTELLGDVRDRTAAGQGTCVGRPVEGLEVRIIRTTDEPLPDWASAEPLPTAAIGEICVAGANVTARYLARPRETAVSKIADPTVPGGLWHRTGDLGYVDATGRLWYCGRKKHRFELDGREVRPVQVEGVFQVLPQVARCAAVRIVRDDGPRLALVVEPAPGHRTTGALEALRSAAVERASGVGLDLRPEDVLVHREPLPVDRRHNTKIHREALTVWAQRRVNGPVARLLGFRRMGTPSAAVGWG